MVPGDAGASRIQIAPDEPVAALSRFHRRDARARSGRAGPRRGRSLNPAEITVLILTKDEARVIARALQSLPANAPAIVIDAESRDDTVAIARNLGAQVLVRPWSGFLETRTYALGLVHTPFAFFLDADEALDEELRAAILAADPPADLAAYRTLRINLFCGKPIYGAGWYPEFLVRLFRPARVHLEAHPATAGGADLHERVVADGPLADLPGRLVHDSYPTIASYWRKFARYTALEAQSLKTSPADLLKATITGALRFAWLLLARRAMFDGWRGFIVAFGSALYPVATHWKALRRP